MTSKTVPVAVIGAGNMGANHLRVYDELPGAELVEVVEPDASRAAEVRDTYDVTVLDSPEDIAVADAATVAVPNHRHREVSETCLQMGLDLLVEKPLAMTVADATAIVDTAKSNDAILQVGLIERFNPAVELLDDILSDEELIAIEAHRLGPFNEHLTQESVVYDLMIHDLDIIRNIVHADCTSLNAVGTTTYSKEIDHAVATMNFEGGVVATATSSHVTHGKVRRLDITTREKYIQLKYQEQSIRIQRRGVEQMTRLENQSGYRMEKITERPFVSTREPLKNEIEHFLACVRNRTKPRVDGEDGIEAIRCASRIVDRILRE
ncbi:Gfo/Idh/MocA family protein [Halorientalis salina]|uniref:Gfo/Idh/MocA family protein n=1 Tax=Halorientalis salina TaxID=2932266 RepID=UPI0010AC4630|nr:Gfo/Idh/MocA family oxidoreductase [Halorientalis salina]